MHANTDYALSLLVTQQLALGLLFVALMLVGAWKSGRFKYLPPAPRRACAFEQCPQTEPELRSVGQDHQAACLLVHSAGGRPTDAQPGEVP